MEYDREILKATILEHWPTATSGCRCDGVSLGASYPDHLANMYELAKMISDEAKGAEAFAHNNLVLKIEMDEPTMEALRAYARIKMEDVIPGGEWRNVLSAEQARKEALRECTCDSLDYGAAIDCPIHGMQRR